MEPENIAENTEAAVEATLPLVADTSSFHPLMQHYLSYRACGFSVREACILAKVNEKTVRRWRATNPEFSRLDTVDVKELVEEFAHKYLSVEFVRNYRLVLRKDFHIITKSISDPASLSKEEQQYLLKLRSHYTPEQLTVLKKMAEAGTLTEFDFTKVVLDFSRERLLVEGSKRQTERD